MKIYNAIGTEILDVIVTSEFETEEDLGATKLLRTNFSLPEKITIPAASYIMFNNIKYTLLKNYLPDANSEAEFRYSVEFQHPMAMLSKLPFLFDEATEWSYTGSAANLLIKVCRIIEEQLGDAQNSWTYTLSIKGDKGIKASESLTFSAVDILTAIGNIADAWECEFYIDYAAKVVYFGYIKLLSSVIDTAKAQITAQTGGCDGWVFSHTDADHALQIDGIDTVNKICHLSGYCAVLAEGDNIQVATSQSEEEYANVFLVRGGTRNISQQNNSGNNVATNQRLKLDATQYPNSYVDIRANQNIPRIVKFLTYDDIYPKLDLYVYNVRERRKLYLNKDTHEKVVIGTDSNNNPVYKYYSIYYIRLAYPVKDANGNITEWRDFTIDPATVDGATRAHDDNTVYSAGILSGCKLMASFMANEQGQHSALAGRDFEMQYHVYNETFTAMLDVDGTALDTGMQVLAGDYEILFTEENDVVIPTVSEMGLIPYGGSGQSVENDKVVLYNITMGEAYYQAARAELAAQALADIAEMGEDKREYEVRSNPVAFIADNPNLSVGMPIKYVDIAGNIRMSRVMKLVTKVDIPAEQTITLSNTRQKKGNTQQLQEEIKNAATNIDLISAVNTQTQELLDAYRRAQQALIEGFNRTANMWHFDANGDIYTPFNVYSNRDVAAYKATVTP